MRNSSTIPALIGLTLGAFLPSTTSVAGLDSGAADSALHQAARAGDVSTIRQRIEAGDPVDVAGERGMTPLHHAAVAGRLDVASLLLDRGANPNALADGDMTALHFASMLAHPELAGLLLRRGARHDIRNASGMMPIHLAANDKVVGVLVAAGADVNALTTEGLSPLHTARHGLVARALIENKADLRIRTPKGRTAMEMAGIETLERVGLSIHSLMLGRLRGIIGQMPVTLTNVSAKPIRDLALTVQSPGCNIDATPVSVPELLPGQNAKMVLTMTRNPNVADGEHPIFLTIQGDGRKLGETDLKVDTRQIVTPEDQGMIRMAKGKIRPAASRWFYLVYGAAPLLVIAVWLLLRRRTTSTPPDGTTES
jgi:ankyrin repeat protein